MHYTRSLILAALLASIPCIAHAELVNQEQFEQYILEGVTHYKAGADNPEEYQAAIQSFQKAKMLNNIPDVTYNIGRCYHMMGDCEHALEYYREYALSSAESAEKVKGYIEELSKQCNDRTGKIKITCVPENAMISIDDADPIPCTATHDLKVGEHSIVAMAEQYMPEQRSVTINPDDKIMKNIVIEMRRNESNGLYPTDSDSDSNAASDGSGQTGTAKSRVSDAVTVGEDKPLGALFWSGIVTSGVGLIFTITGTALVANSNDEFTLNNEGPFAERNETKYNSGLALASIGIIATTAGAVLLVLDRVLPRNNDNPQAVRFTPSFGVSQDSASANLTVTF
ncbi:MAG: hypothetical protein J6A01_07245 [Proteobacteria bacterium]|nr:hypothetical protein [Pseudomonadota bacterium]